MIHLANAWSAMETEELDEHAICHMNRTQGATTSTQVVASNRGVHTVQIAAQPEFTRLHSACSYAAAPVEQKWTCTHNEGAHEFDPSQVE